MYVTFLHIFVSNQLCLIFIWQCQRGFEYLTHCHAITNKWKQIACFLNLVLVSLAITKESLYVARWPLTTVGTRDSWGKPDLISSLGPFFFINLRHKPNFTMDIVHSITWNLIRNEESWKPAYRRGVIHPSSLTDVSPRVLRSTVRMQHRTKLKETFCSCVHTNRLEVGNNE